jgi:two-component system, NtrC family, response regulator AtoC
MTLTIPPLRERVAEIGDLARVFLARAAAQLDLERPPRLSDAALSRLESYDWPGNVRELRNVIERAVVLCPGDTLLPEHLPSRLRGEGTESCRLLPARPETSASRTPVTPARRSEGKEGERERILAALEACAGNQTHAAARLGISRQTLIAKIEAHGLPRPRKNHRA